MIGEDVGVRGGGERERKVWEERRRRSHRLETRVGGERRWNISCMSSSHRIVSIISSLSVFSDAKHRVVLVGHLSPTYYRDQFTILSYEMRTLHLIDECNKK